jgi:hypothetical protein
MLQVNVVYAQEQYDMRGAYNEDGTRQGAVNMTFTREDESTLVFELDGTYLANATTAGAVFTWDLGYNESRTMYVYGNETIYVMLPYDPYYNYYFSVIDFAGLEWGYLESLVNLNGTDRVCERQSIEIVNDIPFMFTWGRTYKMRLVCNLGEYVFGDYVAGATTAYTLTVTADFFPTLPTHIGDLTVSATRENETWIRCAFIDAETQTDWVEFAFYEYGNDTAFHTYNTTSNSVIYNWYEGDSFTDYFVIVTVSHQTLGTKYWTYTCPAPVTGYGNPFAALALLGDFPFDITQLPAILIIIVCMMAFSWWNAPLGIIVSTLIAFVLAWLGWLSIGWTWLSLAGSLSFLLAIAMRKDRERGV